MKFQRTVILISMLGLSGCLMTRGELNDSEEKKATQLQLLQRQKADADVQVSNLEDQLRQSNGRIETLEHKNGIIVKAYDEQTTRVVTLEGRVKALEDGMVQLSQEFDTLKLEAMSVASSAASGGKKSAAGSAADEKKNSFAQAEEFVSQKEWKKAISLYQKYLEANPRGEEVPNATYKIGVCLQELKMNKEARVFLEEVVERFPKTKAARSAAFRLNQMKKH